MESPICLACVAGKWRLLNGVCFGRAEPVPSVFSFLLKVLLECISTWILLSFRGESAAVACLPRGIFPTSSSSIESTKSTGLFGSMPRADGDWIGGRNPSSPDKSSFNDFDGGAVEGWVATGGDDGYAPGADISAGASGVGDKWWVVALALC